MWEILFNFENMIFFKIGDFTYKTGDFFSIMGDYFKNKREL